MIYLTGDTHGNARRLSSGNWPEGKLLTKQDYLIILGDFGFLWADDSQDRYWLNWLDEKPWTTLFLDGNHENFDMIDALPSRHMFNSTVGVVNDSIFHLRRGHLYNIDGNTIFTLGGGLSIDKHMRKEGKSWWPQEAITGDQMEFAWSNLLDVGMEVDYILTHTCPTDVLACYGITGIDKYGVTHPKSLDPASFMLQDIAIAAQFKHWYHGHIHEDTTKMGRFTCLQDKIIQLGEVL